MSFIKNIDHIGIAVNDIEQAISIYADVLGLNIIKIESYNALKIKICFISIGEILIELIEPLTPDAKIAQFINQNGEGLHHIAFKVDNLNDEILDSIKTKIKLLDNKPKIGALGSKMVFINPECTNNVLIELVGMKNEG